MKNTSKRIDLIDYLKAVSIIMVIITHFSWGAKSFPTFTYLIRMAVPIFMILSGYNAFLSYSKKNASTPWDMYRPDKMLPKLIWLILPYSVIYFIELYFATKSGMHFTFPQLLGFFWAGGLGEGGFGGYYFPLLLEFTLLAPLFYLLMKWNAKWGLTIIGGLNLTYELIVLFTNMPKPVYRLLLFRYLLLIGFGFYLYTDRKIKNWLLVFWLAVGALYVTYVDYGSNEKILFLHWRNTCMMCAFYIFPIIYWLFEQFKYSRLPGIFGKLMSMIGQSSYHIFLTQMLYYRLHMGNRFSVYGIPANVILNIIFCVTIGILFHLLEAELRKVIKSIQKKKELTVSC